MTKDQTTILIRTTAKHLFAAQGYEGLSMRTLSHASSVGLSSIYHFFEDKDVLLKDIFDHTNTALGLARKQLRARPTAALMLRDRIAFQFAHIEDIVFVLKYYLHYRSDFMALPTKTLPAKSVLHIEEVLHKGISTGEFTMAASQLETQAKIIAHAVNGFLLEYYPDPPRGAAGKQLVDDLTMFIMRSLTSRETPME